MLPNIGNKADLHITLDIHKELPERRGIGAEPSAAAVPAVELSPLHPFETL